MNSVKRDKMIIFAEEMMSMRILCIFILLLLSGIGCKSKINVTDSELKGKWVITKALRNGKVTKTLNAGFLMFKDDNLVNSNIFESAENKKFTLEENRLIIAGDEHFEWNIVHFSKDSMQLEGTMHQFDMELNLKKVEGLQE